MKLGEIWTTVLMFICGAGGLALINIAQERWKMRYQRKAEREDRKADREDKLDEISKQLSDYIEKQEEFNQNMTKRFEDMDNSDKSQQEGMKYVLLDRILYIGQSYIKKGEVTYDERKRLGDMHDVYHKKLGGNGDADAIMKAVYELPLKK